MVAAAAGKHVVVEKPLEITGPRCEQIIDACDKHEVKLCTIFPSRFADANIALKAAVDAGKFGRLTLGETTCKWWRSQAYYDEGGWKGTQALDGGGALMNQAIHNVDLLLWMMGAGDARLRLHRDARPRADRGRGHRRRRHALPSGALGVHPGDDERPPRLPEDDRHPRRQGLGGDRAGGRAAVGLRRRRRRTTTAVKERFAAKVGASGGAADPKAISHEGHRRQLADFVDAIRDNRPPKVDGREGEEGGRSDLRDLREQPDRPGC